MGKTKEVRSERTTMTRKTKHYRAAGGVVLDDAGRVLLLERRVPREGEMRHEIRLPKGHIEDGETPEEAARREVCEESGYCGLEILDDLGLAVTEFDFRNKHIRRVEHYFLMRLASPTRRAPQPKSPHAEEALFEPLWAEDLDEAERLLTYESEKEFIRRAKKAV
ncbi:MAG: NUDIX domain-containing protein [Chloroflexi bacterium]|nr:NUDIX domain-containing protein [Chloroflexota bacterium]